MIPKNSTGVIIYRVVEQNPAGATLSEFRTPDYWLALAETLRLVRRTVDTGENRTRQVLPRISVLDVVVAEDPYRLTMQLSRAHPVTDAKLSEVRLTTARATDSTWLGLRATPDRQLVAAVHERSLIDVSERLRQWSEDEPDVGQVLTLYAAQNEAHPFWNTELDWRGRRPF